METNCTIKFFIIRVWGDMAAGRYDDQYPTKIVCESCLEGLKVEEDEGFTILEISEYRDGEGAICDACGLMNE